MIKRTIFLLLLAISLLFSQCVFSQEIQMNPELKMQVSTYGNLTMLTPFLPESSLGNKTAAIDWGDGVMEVFSIDNGFATHLFRQAGVYPIVVHVKQENGEMQVVTGEVEVSGDRESGSVSIFSGDEIAMSNALGNVEK